MDLNSNKTDFRDSNTRLLDKVNKDILQLEDGYYYYWKPSDSGALAAWALRVIADELDRRNAAWDKEVNDYFDKQQKGEVEVD